MTRTPAPALPRIGARRDLKAALDAYWRGARDLAALEAAVRDLRARRWRMQQAAGIGPILANDASPCDPALDMIATLGAAPKRFAPAADGEIGLETRLTMARGAVGAPAMRQARLFGGEPWATAPELAPGQGFRLAARDAERAFQAAQALGVTTRPVLMGPVSWLSLARAEAEGFDPLTLLPAALPVYAELLARLAAAGADWVRIEEPVLACALDQMQRAAFWTAYDALADGALRLMVGFGAGAPAASLDVAAKLPVAGLHLEPRHDPRSLSHGLAALLAGVRPRATLSLGAPDRCAGGADALRAAAARAARMLGVERVEIAPSAALLDGDAAPEGLAAAAALARALRDGRGLATDPAEADAA